MRFFLNSHPESVTVSEVPSRSRIRQYFDRDAVDFARNRWLGSERARRDFSTTQDILFRELDVRDSHRVIEFGCGPGIWTELLAEKAAHVVGVDISDAMLAEARVRVANRSNVTLVNADLLEFQADQPFDRVTLVRVLEYLPDKGEALKTTSRLLVRGGKAVIITKPSKNVHMAKRWLNGLLPRRQVPTELPVWHVQPSELESLGKQCGLVCRKVVPVLVSPMLSRAFPRLQQQLEWCHARFPAVFSPFILFFCETFAITFERE